MEKTQSELGVPWFLPRLWVDPPDKTWTDFVDDTDEPVRIMEGKQEEVNGKLPPQMIRAANPGATGPTVRNLGQATSK